MAIPSLQELASSPFLQLASGKPRLGATGCSQGREPLVSGAVSPEPRIGAIGARQSSTPMALATTTVVPGAPYQGLEEGNGLLVVGGHRARCLPGDIPAHKWLIRPVLWRCCWLGQSQNGVFLVLQKASSTASWNRSNCVCNSCMSPLTASRFPAWQAFSNSKAAACNRSPPRLAAAPLML